MPAPKHSKAAMIAPAGMTKFSPGNPKARLSLDDEVAVIVRATSPFAVASPIAAGAFLKLSVRSFTRVVGLDYPLVEPITPSASQFIDSSHGSLISCDLPDS